jgi:hypothetical protein
MNLGNIDMSRLLEAARMRGISADELDTALAGHNMTGLAFNSSSV